MKTMFRKTYLEVILLRFLLENDVVLVKIDFGLEVVERDSAREKTKCLKNCHIYYIKTENTRFLQVRQSRY